MCIWLKQFRIHHAWYLFAFAVSAIGMATVARADEVEDVANRQEMFFEPFLPPPLNDQWSRSDPVSGPADQDRFKAGISSYADYRSNIDNCTLRITITGNSPMMQNYSMNFSNPAAASLTGSQLSYVDSEPIVTTLNGEVQTLTRNFLTQYTGTCSHEHKLDYVAVAPRAALREYSLPPATAGSVDAQPTMRGLQWAHAFGGAEKDWAYGLTATKDGGLCTAGRTASQGVGLEDAWLVRMAGDGRMLWNKTFGGAAIDRGRGIVELADRGLVVAGATESSGAGEFDVWVFKVDADGELLWDRQFGGAATDWASALVATHDGGVAVAAYTQDESEGPYDFWVLKLDGAGALQWQRRFGGKQTDWSNAITATADNGLVVAGHTESSGAGGADFWVLKLGADGELLWQRTFGGKKTDYASAVATTRGGDLLVAGMTLSAGAGLFDGRIVRLTDSGDVIWDKTFGGAGNDWIRAIVQTQDGNYTVAGYTDSQGAGQNDVWLFKLAPDGTLLWERTYGDTGNEWARALAELPDGALALAGDTYSMGAGAADVLVLKIAGAE